MQVNAFAQPYSSHTGDVGVLFCHGFTSSPWTVLAWAQATAAAGYRVSLPRLPGHGTCWQELNTSSWRDWYFTLDREFHALRRDCRQVFVAGLSLGGGLALRLAERHADDVSGLVLVNPAVQAYPASWLAPVLWPVLPSIGSSGSDIADTDAYDHTYHRTPLRAVASMMKLWTDVRACLDLVTCPLLLFRSQTDHVVPAASSRFILSHISSADITEHVLMRSYHVATLDYDKQTIADESLEFLAAHTKKLADDGAPTSS